MKGSFFDYQRNSSVTGKKMYNFTCDIVDKVPGGLDDKWVRKCPPGTKSCFYAEGVYGAQSKFIRNMSIENVVGRYTRRDSITRLKH